MMLAKVYAMESGKLYKNDIIHFCSFSFFPQVDHSCCKTIGLKTEK